MLGQADAGKGKRLSYRLLCDSRVNSTSGFHPIAKMLVLASETQRPPSIQSIPLFITVSETMAAPRSMAQEQQQTQQKGSGIFRSIMSKDHKRNKSQSDVLSARHQTQTVPLLPADHPHCNTPVYVEEDERSGRQARKENVPPHKRSKSTVSLRSLGRTKDTDKTKEKEKERKNRKEKKSQQDEGEPRQKPKKTKSSTSLAGMFARMNRSSKDLSQVQQDKENMMPPSSASESTETPIWAHFASPQPPHAEPSQHAKDASYFDVPRQHLENEIARYTPQDYSPSKQRNFAAHGPPTLSRPRSSARPKSALITGSTSFMDSLSRTISGDRSQIESRGSDRPPSSRGSKEHPTRSPTEPSRTHTGDTAHRKASSSSNEPAPPTQGLTIAKRGARVMAAVAALNGKTNANLATKDEPALDPASVNAAFEAVLVRTRFPLSSATRC